jgi:hypothetical protein
MLTAVLCAGLTLALALLMAIYRRIDGVPARVRTRSQDERAQDEAHAMRVLQEAAASRASALVLGLRSYHEQLEGRLRAEVAASELHARVVERRSADAAASIGAVLDAATELLRQLRALVDRQSALSPEAGAASAPAVATAKKERQTIEILQDPAGDGEPTPLGPRPQARAPSATLTLAAGVDPAGPSSRKQGAP